MSISLSQGHTSYLNSLLRERLSYMKQWDFSSPFLSSDCSLVRGWGWGSKPGWGGGLFFVWLLSSTWWPERIIIGRKKKTNKNKKLKGLQENSANTGFFVVAFPESLITRTACSLCTGVRAPGCLQEQKQLLGKCVSPLSNIILICMKRLPELCWIDSSELLSVVGRPPPSLRVVR